MPVFIVYILSAFLYIGFFYLLIKRRDLLASGTWISDPTIRIIWHIWIFFLAVFSPLTYHGGDMGIWRDAMVSIIAKLPFPAGFTYLPFYAQTLAALYLPFRLMGIQEQIVQNIFVQIPPLVAYIYSPRLMAKLLPEKYSNTAPLAIVLAPITIFYLFFGTNHIVMLFFLLLTLVMLKQDKWFWAGVFALFSCYKLLLVPTMMVLGIIVIHRYGWRKLGILFAGGVTACIPSIIYYIFMPDYFRNTLFSLGATGVHTTHVDSFHFFYIFTHWFSGFEAWYVDGKIWFILSMLGVALSLVLYFTKRLSFLQALAAASLIVALVATESFRIEPAIGLLWLDAVYREDKHAQIVIFIALFAHAVLWFPDANSLFLEFPWKIRPAWTFRGLYLGIPLTYLLLYTLIRKDLSDPLMVE